MSRRPLLIKNANIIDENGKVSYGKDIYLEDGKIKKIGNIDIYNHNEIIDATGLYVTLGFVNLHTHSPMNIFKGIAEDVNIDDWFNKIIFPYESKLNSEEVYWGSMLSIAEMIDNGVTSFADHYFFSESIIRAVYDSGIRGDVAPTIFGMAPNFNEQVEEATKLIKINNGTNSRINIRLGPHSPYTCSKEQLKFIVDTAKEIGVGLHLHVSETEQQVLDNIKKYGVTPFKLLEEIGALKIPLIVGHGLWVQEEDIDRLTETTYFAVCPKTYMKLSMGKGNIWNFNKEINISFGTDGAASSNTQSPLEQCRYFALNGKFIGGVAENYDLIYIWKALMKGHQALTFNGGKLQEGYCGDLLFWDLNKINTAPVYNPLASIIYSSDARNIVHSIIDGKFVKKHGKVLLNLEHIIDEVEKVKNRIIPRGKGKSKVTY